MTVASGLVGFVLISILIANEYILSKFLLMASLFSINLPKPYKVKEPTQEPRAPITAVKTPATTASLTIKTIPPMTEPIIPIQATTDATVFIFPPMLSNICIIPFYSTASQRSDSCAHSPPHLGVVTTLIHPFDTMIHYTPPPPYFVNPQTKNSHPLHSRSPCQGAGVLSCSSRISRSSGPQRRTGYPSLNTRRWTA